MVLCLNCLSLDTKPDSDSPIIAGGHNTVVLIGCLLLLLNFLCFIGLFYQRERLKKAEIQLRKRYIETQKQLGVGTEESQELDSSVYAERSPPAHVPYHHPHHSNMPQIARDAMSETETENGFGPDFLGPNYDPRTKVNRWMQMQAAANNRMLGKGNSFEEYSNPTPTPSDMHRHNRLSRVREDENPYESALPPSYHRPHHQHQLPMAPSPVILGLNQLPYQSPPPNQQLQQPLHVSQGPMQIQLNSVQRPGVAESVSSPSNPSAPKAQPEPPVQFHPHMPYQEGFRPSGHLGSDSIPYADSRATSPSIISAPAGFSNVREGKGPFLRGQMQNPTEQSKSPYKKQPSSSVSLPSPTPSSATLADKISNDSPKSSSIIVTPITSETPKRTSTLIVRDLDPPDEELENAEPKYVPVRTGTLKRSVAVDTDHDGSPAVGINENNGTEGSSPSKTVPTSQIRVSFKENL
jgi:hypothetical protein